MGEVLVQVRYPTTGLLHQEGHTYLFTEIAHVDNVEDVWAFAEVTSSEMWMLVGAAGPDAFHDLRLTLLAGRRVSFAYAPSQRIRNIKTVAIDGRGVAGVAAWFFDKHAVRGRRHQAALAAHG